MSMCPFVCIPANHLTDKDAKAFAEALKENRTLTHLDLSYNQIGEMGGIYLGAGVVSNVWLRSKKILMFFNLDLKSFFH